MFDLNWTLAVSATVFLITLLLLNQFLFKPIWRILDEREAGSTDVSRRTDEILERYQALLEDYQQKVREERQAGYKVAEASRVEALQERARIIAEARLRAEKLLEQASEEIQANVAAAQDRLLEEAEAIARLVAAKVLGRA